jgi:pilin isopeptide linkage protein
MNITKKNNSFMRALAGVLLLIFALLAPLGNLALADTPATLNIPVYKVLSGIPAASETFTFRLTALNNAPMPAGTVNGVRTTTITLSPYIGSGSSTFGTIVYTAVGDYQYTISEVAGTNPDFVYDTTVYDLTVQVTWRDYPGGALQAIMYLTLHNQDVKQAQALFTNTVSASYVIVDPPVEKRITGDRPSTNSTFTFVMRADNTSYPMPAGSTNGEITVTVVGSGVEDFGNITYTSAGTYTYTIYERVGTVSGYRYDSTVYHMTVTVTNVNGQLTATRTITNAAGAVQSGLIFTNVYTSPDGPKTGDVSKAYLWWILIALGVACLVAALLPKKKKKE